MNRSKYCKLNAIHVQILYSPENGMLVRNLYTKRLEELNKELQGKIFCLTVLFF